MRIHPVGVAALIAIVVTACSAESGADSASTATTEAAQVSSTTSSTTTTTPPSTTVTTATTAASTTTTSTLPDPAQLIGTWLDPSIGVHLTFDVNGNHDVRYVGGEPFESGQYTLDGARLTMAADEGSDPVCVGLGPGVFDIVIDADRRWMFGRVVRDPCPERARSLTGGLWGLEHAD